MAMCTVRIIFYGLMAFSTPQAGKPFEALVYDARQTPYLMPGVMTHEHEMRIDVCDEDANCQTVDKGGHDIYRFLVSGPQNPPANQGSISDRLPELGDKPMADCKASNSNSKCGVLAWLEIDSAKPYVCHEVHEPKKPKRRRKFAMIALAPEPPLTTVTYHRMGDAVAADFEQRCDQPVQIEKTPIQGGKKVMLNVPLDESERTIIVVSNAPAPSCETLSMRAIDISAHSTLLYAGKIETVSATMACEAFLHDRETKTCPRFVPHDPVTCIPPRY